MSSFNDYLFPLHEAHAHLTYDGESFHLDGLPNGVDSVVLPELYKRGISAIYNLLEKVIPQLSGIYITGMWFSQQRTAPFEAFDLWVQQGEEGFYLPMATASTLFRDNGIPYYHKPLGLVN